MSIHLLVLRTNKPSFNFRYLNRDNLIFLLSFVSLVIVNYFLPTLVRDIVFLSLIGFFMKSKDDAFWISLFFVILWAPGFIFSNNDPQYNLNILVFPGFGREISYFEYFIVALLVKASFNKFRHNRITLPWSLIFILYYTVFLFMLSFLLGISEIKIIRTLRLLLPYTLLFALPKLLWSEEKYRRIFNYFIVFSIIVFILQLYVLISGQHIMSLLGGSLEREEMTIELEYDANTELIRPNYSTHILIIGMAFLAFTMIRDEFVNLGSRGSHKVFLLIILLAIFLTGTRGYILFSLITIFGLFSILKQKITSVVKGTAIIILLLVIMSLFPVIETQYGMAFERFSTVFLFAQGDITAGGTLQRINYYVPVIEQGISLSPILGLGFSDDFFTYTNAHVGNHNVILGGGLIGFILFIALFINFSKIPYLIYKKTKEKSYLIFCVVLFGFFVVHSSSYAVFSFLVGQANYSVFFLFLSYLVLLKNKYLI